MNKDENLMDKIVSLCKRRGFIFPGSEIYGGLAGTWDYGPLGSELKNNIKQEFWKAMVHKRMDIVGFDAAIMMNPKVWEASGHLEAFSDPLVECKLCHMRFRADHKENLEEHQKIHKGKKIEWTSPKKFNLLVEAKLGVVEEEKTTVYLRGEITQGVHVNFKNIVDAARKRIPFGAAQIGKAFRNEITPGNFTFRSREFEQMELQYYVKPDKKEGERWFEYWKKERMNWYLNLGMKKENLRFREHESDERAHYAQAAWDIEYQSPFGWKEFEGIHHRGDWDLKRHAQYSHTDLTYTDPETNEKYTPWIIETSGGVDRAALFFLVDAYHEEEAPTAAASKRGEPRPNGREEGETETRVVLKLDKRLAPIQVAVLPLSKNEKLIPGAKAVAMTLTNHFKVEYDETQSIGKRYRRQDEIGTPYCITYDFDSDDDKKVTVRERDSMRQDRIAIEELVAYLNDKFD